MKEITAKPFDLNGDITPNAWPNLCINETNKNTREIIAQTGFYIFFFFFFVIFKLTPVIVHSRTH